MSEGTPKTANEDPGAGNVKSKTWVDFGLLGAGIAVCIAMGYTVPESGVQFQLVTAGICAIVAGFLTNELIPVVSEWTLKKGLFGRDLGKKHAPEPFKSRHV